MWVTMISLLTLGIIIVKADPMNLTKCNTDIDTLVNTSNPKQFYGGLNAFYSINKGIADGLQKQMNDETLQNIYNYITGADNRKSLGTVIDEVVKEQAGAIAFFCGGLLIILIALFLGITICTCRCCCNSCGADKKKKNDSSVVGVMGLGFLLFTSFSFILTGLVIFNLSAQNVYSAIDNSNIWINDVIIGVSKTVDQGTYEMQCTVNNSVDYTFGQLEQKISQFVPNLTVQLLNVTGILSLNSFPYTSLSEDVNLAGKEAGAVGTDADDMDQNCGTQKAELLSQLKNLTGALFTINVTITIVNNAQSNASNQINNGINSMDIDSQLNYTISQMTLIQNQISEGLQTVTTQVNQSMETVWNLQNAVNSAYNDIQDWKGTKPVEAGWQALVSIPLAICLLFCLLTIIGLICWMASGNGGRGMGYVAICGFYFTIFLTVVAMGVTSAAFVGGWAISGVCKPMFEDQSFRIFGLIDNLVNINITGLNGTSSTTTVQQLMQRCEKNSTVFNAVGGYNLINVAMVNYMLNLTEVQKQIDGAIESNSINYTINNQTLVDVDNSLSLLDPLVTYFTNVANSTDPCFKSEPLHTNLTALADTLMRIRTYLVVLQEDITTAINNSQSNVTTITAINFTNDQFNNSTSMINDSISDMLDQLNTNAFPCYGLYQSYENAGTIVCDWFGRPIHGMWGAAGLAAIFFIPAALFMLCAANTLFTGRRKIRSKAKDREDYEIDDPDQPHVRSHYPQDRWNTDNDDAPIRTDYPQPLPRTTSTTPWMDNSGGLRRQGDNYQGRENDSYSKTGLRRLGDKDGAAGGTSGRRGWQDSGWDAESESDRSYNIDKGAQVGRGLTRRE